MKEKAKRYLLYGIIGGILTMIGDRLLLGAISSQMDVDTRLA